MVLRGGELHLMTRLNGVLLVVGQGGELFLRRGDWFVDRTGTLLQPTYGGELLLRRDEWFVDRTGTLPQPTYHRYQRARFAVSLSLEYLRDR